MSANKQIKAWRTPGDLVNARAVPIRAKYYKPEITEVNIHWKMLPSIHRTVKVHLTSDVTTLWNIPLKGTFGWNMSLKIHWKTPLKCHDF